MLAVRRALRVLAVATLAVVVGVELTGCDQPYGVNQPPWALPAPSNAYRLAGELGFQWMRLALPWEQIETVQNACRDTPDCELAGDPTCACRWGIYGQAIEEAHAAGFSVLVTLLVLDPTKSPPWWASCRASGNVDATCAPTSGYAPAPEAAAFENFAEAATRHFGAKVAAWQMWNEPQDPKQFPGTPCDFQECVLLPGVAGVRRADPAATVVGPGIFGGCHSALDAYLTRCSAGNKCTVGQPTDCVQPLYRGRHTVGRVVVNSAVVLAAPIDAYGVHTYGTADDIAGWLATTSGYARCTDAAHCSTTATTNSLCTDGAHCLTEFWLDEFGFTTTCGCLDGDPGQWAASIFDRCAATAHCRKAFYWDLTGEYPPCSGEACGLPLLNADGRPRPRVCALQGYLRAKRALPSVLCPTIEWLPPLTDLMSQ
jgi:hypothetical protein